MGLSFTRGSGLGNLSSAMSQQRRVGGQRGSARFTLTMEPDARDIDMAFSKWANLIDDWGPAFRDVVELFHKHEKRHFRTSGRSTGPKFVKLSKSYKEWKSRVYPGRQILVLRGALRTALIKGGSGTDGIAKVTSTSLVVGLKEGTKTAVYGRAHSLGERLHNGGVLPKRPPVRYDPSVHVAGLKEAGAKGGLVPLGTAIAQLFQVYIVKARKQAQADKLFSDRMNWRSKRRGVLALRTR